MPAPRARWIQRPRDRVDVSVVARRRPAQEPITERLLRSAPPTSAVGKRKERSPGAVCTAANACLVQPRWLRLRAACVDVLLVYQAAVQKRPVLRPIQDSLIHDADEVSPVVVECQHRRSWAVDGWRHLALEAQDALALSTEPRRNLSEISISLIDQVGVGMLACTAVRTPVSWYRSCGEFITKIGVVSSGAMYWLSRHFQLSPTPPYFSMHAALVCELAFHSRSAGCQ